MSAQQLADRCTELGYPIKRSVLANFENGRRPTISVVELIVLARALDVAPAMLLFPVDDPTWNPARPSPRDAAMMEALPGTVVPLWTALEWWSGEGPLVSGGGANLAPPALTDNDHWNLLRLPFYWLRIHRESVGRWQDYVSQSAERRRLAVKLPDPEKSRLSEMADAAMRAAESAARGAMSARRTLRRMGVQPPPLPDMMAHLDQEDPSDEDAYRRRYSQLYRSADPLDAERLRQLIEARDTGDRDRLRQLIEWDRLPTTNFAPWEDAPAPGLDNGAEEAR